MPKVKFTGPQIRVLKALADGAKIVAYAGHNGAQCFASNESGLRSTLYLTLTMRALKDKGAVLCLNSIDCLISETGLAAIKGAPLPCEH